MASEYEGDWRYKSVDNWVIDTLEHYSDYEDDIIDWIDNGNKIKINDKEPEHSLLVWIEEMMDERQAFIMKQYCWEGKSMASIGRELQITRVRVWQIYKEVLEIIKIRCDNDWEKYKLLFIGHRDDEHNCRRSLVIDDQYTYGDCIRNGKKDNNNKGEK